MSSQGLIPRGCSRFEVAAAYAAFGDWWNRDGLTERCRAKHKSISGQLFDMGYSPGMGGYFDGLYDPAINIYLELVRRWHPDCYEEECAKADAGELE